MVLPKARQFLVFAVLAIATAGMASIVDSRSPMEFDRFIGTLHPLVTFVAINSLGLVALAFLLNREWFSISKKGNVAGRLGAMGLAALLASITVLLDLKIVFPRDLNVGFPLSLLFYPAIGFLVEIVFHVLPLAVILALLTSRMISLQRDRAVWIGIVVVSLLEPAFQVASMVASLHYPNWAALFLAVHLTLFNLLQLVAFKRYDFLAMYSMRLAYYAIWHVAWGYLRLRVLF